MFRPVAESDERDGVVMSISTAANHEDGRNGVDEEDLVVATTAVRPPLTPPPVDQQKQRREILDRVVDQRRFLELMTELVLIAAIGDDGSRSAFVEVDGEDSLIGRRLHALGKRMELMQQYPARLAMIVEAATLSRHISADNN